MTDFNVGPGIATAFADHGDDIHDKITEAIDAVQRSRARQLP